MEKVSPMSLEFVSPMSLEFFVTYVLDWFKDHQKQLHSIPSVETSLIVKVAGSIRQA